MTLPLRIFQLLLLSVMTAVGTPVTAGETSSGNVICEDCFTRPADSPLAGERRVALVIGNGGYQAAGTSLPNPPSDARDMAAVLKAIGFDVVTVIDATKRDMDLALARFARLATSADTALFYYAGHALQIQGRNFLLPTDGKLEDEISVSFETIGLEEVHAVLDRASGVKVLILDACRDNPLVNRLKGAGTVRGGIAARGLAPVEATQGMVIAYATAAGGIADDGLSRNSPFTAALLKRLQQPGLEVEMMFGRIASDVSAQTNGRQRPATYISLLSEYYLNRDDRVAWDSIKDKDDILALHDFVSKYPSSPFASIARDRLVAQEREDLARRQQGLRVQEQRIRTEELAVRRRIEEERRRQDGVRGAVSQ
jgi:hypothetical protein